MAEAILNSVEARHLSLRVSKAMLLPVFFAQTITIAFDARGLPATACTVKQSLQERNEL
jgi:hypothetical protein